VTVSSATHLDARTEAYVREVLETLDAVVPLLEAYLIGSGAAGGFDPQTSDVDLIGVVARPLGAEREALLRNLLEIPCPVRDLQLVLYVTGTQPPQFELNLSDGKERPDEDGFWFVLDAAVAHDWAVPVWGERPWGDFFKPVSPVGLRRALAESIAWSERHAGSDFAQLNALRAQHYLEHGEWISKREARS
jgi:hypothetical protein